MDSRVLIGDGAMGTLLAERGVGFGHPYARANVTHPEMVAGILGRIEAKNYDVFSGRAETSRPRKLLVAARVAARDPREILTRSTSRL